MPRSIVHLDADAFFASVEQTADSRLRGKPIAVGGEKRGIIASASYEARKFGIYTPMPTIMARRLCPKLILLPGDFEKYELFSRLMFSYAYDFTPDVEIGSIDEGYFDLTGTRKPAKNIAETIRDAIRQSLKLSVSEGIAGNKLVSQIASKLKKPSAFEFVPHGHEAEFLSPLANKWLPGVGPKTANQLSAAGLVFIGQVARTPIDLLGLLVGKMAPQMHNFSLGIDERPVVPVRAPAKSYGEQETFGADTTDEEFLEATLRRMADKLMAKVRADGKSIRTLAVKVRYNDMDEEQASESLAEPTDIETETYAKISALLRKAWRRRVSLRLVSLKLSNVYNSPFRCGLALEVSDQHRAAQQRLADTVDELRQKFGHAILYRGHDFILRLKNGRGEEPVLRRQHTGDRTQESGVQSSKFKVQGSRFSGSVSQVKELLQSPSKTPYHLAVVQRQRIGNSFARVMASPAPELRFRTELKPQAAHLPSIGKALHSPSGFGLRASAFGFRPSDLPPIPLNLHSYYSFLDSTLSIHAIIRLAKQYDLPAIALTDRNNLHGAVEFAQAAAEAGIKPIIGAELDWHGHRLCLYVQNQTGYTNLCRMLNQNTGDGRRETGGENPKSEIRNPKFKVQGLKSSSEQISNFKFQISNSLGSTEGLLAVSSCPELAPFFPERFYLELNSLEVFEKYQSINPSIHQSSHPLPAVASFPTHYALPSDRWKYDIVQSIRTLTLLRQPHPEKRLEGDYHFRTSTEMQQLFAAHPELLAHSHEIADRCSFSFCLGQPQFPSYPPPDGSTPAAFLYRLIMDGLRRRYPNDHARLKPQLEEELAIITEVGYEEYFLVMWDILQECRRRGIEWITRGSAADSLACYCLEISSVCPIRFDLYFRRFLNKDRMALNKLPDIDVDFPHDRKDDVIDLIFGKYGPSNTAIVGGFSTFQSRSAFAEVAKVLGVSEFEVRRLTERLPHFSRASELGEIVTDTLECRDLPLDQEPYSTALQMARFLDGFPRYPKMHPCGLVLSRQPMREITPCFTSAKGYPTTHFDMDSVEAVGLIKMDILAQGGLAVMRDVMESVHSQKAAVRGHESSVISQQSEIQNPKAEIRNPKSEDQGQVAVVQGPRFEVRSSKFLPPTPIRSSTTSDFDLRPSFGFRPSDFGLPSPAGPFDNPEVWDLIASGSARAVHHIESPAMISLCKMCNVRDIDTLIAIVSVIRPGAANESKKMEFARRYQGLSPVRYPHPSLESCLRSTYGLVVYEEHILQICEAFAGLPPGRADILRRALGKDKTDLIAQIQTEFADCARKHGRTEFEITEVWNLVAGFRGYAFCKAHSTAYGVEAYQSAWLKRYYPAEFMAAVLTNGKGFYDPLVYVLECHRLGIPLLPPSVNEPGPAFRVAREEGNPKSEIRNPKTESQDQETGDREIMLSLGSHITPINYAGAGVFPSPPLEERAGERRPFLIPVHEKLRPLALDAPWDHASCSCPEPAKTRTSNLPEAPQVRSSKFEVQGSEFSQAGGSALLDYKLRSSFDSRRLAFGLSIRVPVLLVNGLTLRTKETILREHERTQFSSLADFLRRVHPLPEEMEALIRVGAFDIFGQSRTAQYWEFKGNAECKVQSAKCGTRKSEIRSQKSGEDAGCESQISNSKFQIPNSRAQITNSQLWLLPSADFDRLPSVPLVEPDRLQRLRAEEELLGYPVSGHPLELFPDIAWDTYCSVNRLGDHIGKQVVTCGLVIEQRLFHQITGEPMKFLTLADWTGVIETELFARTYKSYGLSTIRYRVLEITATVEPFENNRGYTLRVLRAGKPRTKPTATGRSANDSPTSLDTGPRDPIRVFPTND